MLNFVVGDTINLEREVINSLYHLLDTEFFIPSMGIYINKGNEGFFSAVNSDYVDKSGMIAVINKTLNTERRYTCVTRSRRFGKSMAVDMLRAYYDESCDSESLFDGLIAKKSPTFSLHLNRYPVVNVDITDFITKYAADSHIVKYMQEEIIADLLAVYPKVERVATDDLMNIFIKIYDMTGRKFIMLIDEWDAIYREYSNNNAVTDEYLNLLRRMFKGSGSKDVFAGVYMTGILPIKKYDTQSALNNFREYSVVEPGTLDKYFGFTPEEVCALASDDGVTMDELKTWYDGYSIGNETSIYNPYSVIEAISRGRCGSFWSSTAAYDSVATYIEMNYKGLKDDIILMLAGGRCSVDTTGFTNDIHDIRSKDDVLTVLIHLGYLAYDSSSQECFIPNKEVRMEMANAVKSRHWKVADALEKSKNLLRATIDGDQDAVAHGIELAHDANTSILSYHDENSMACVLTIAYYHAMNDYVIHRELPTGKGFADLVFIPRRNVSSPAIVVELKYNKDAVSAIDQIKLKNYPAKVAEYLETSGGASSEIILVGINYDKDGAEGKKHTCVIERE